MKKCTLFTMLLLLYGFSGLAQWDNLNPGAGGQVQDIVPDPNINGRLFLVSDMEGVYRTNDNGETWHYTSDDLIHHRTYDVTVQPGNSNRVYAGTIYGLHISNNGGINWKLVKNTKGYSIGEVSVSKQNPNLVIAAEGWRDDYNYGGKKGTHNKSGPLTIFRSADRGVSWKKIIVDPSFRDANSYTVTFRPNRENVVYLASDRGLFRSNDGGRSWYPEKNPNNTFACTGLAFDPTGNYMYASYQSSTDRRGQASLYTSKSNNTNWRKLAPSGNNGVFDDSYSIWYPEVDPASTQKVHRLVLPLVVGRPGLFEVSVSWESGSPRPTWKKIWTTDLNNYDIGWEYAPPGPRVAHYAPPNWKWPAVWSTINQSMHRATIPRNGKPYVWENKYCNLKEGSGYSIWEGTQYTYSTKGTASTYTYDIAVLKNYVLQGQADNGAMESWDYGKSWSNITGRKEKMYDASAVAIAKYGTLDVALAQGDSKYGGGSTESRLFMKKLETFSPDDRWQFIGGHTQKLGRLPNDRILEIAVNPRNKERVYIGFVKEGLWLIDNLKRFVDNPAKYPAKKISGSQFSAIREVAFDTNNGNMIYVSAISGDEGLYQAIRNNGNLEYTWKKLISGSGAGAQIKSWKHGNDKYEMYTAKLNGENHYSVLLRKNYGAWKVQFNRNIAEPLRTNKWYNEIKDSYRFNMAGVAAHGDQIVVSYYDHQWEKGYGIFKGEIQGNGNVSWQDWSGNNHFKAGTDAEIFEVKGKLYYYQGTQGVGMLRRRLTVGQAAKSVAVLPAADTGDNVVQNLVMYPNPAKNTFSFAVEKNVRSVQLYDLAGKRVLQIQQPIGAQKIDISALQKGIYTVNFQFEDGVETSKSLIIN